MIDEVDAPKRRGRPRKTPFISVLSREVIEGLLTPAQIVEREHKDKDAKRKRDERARTRVEKELDSVTTKEELWEKNRKLIPEAELTTLLEKQEHVFDQVHWVNGVLGGTNLPPDDPDYVSVEEGAEDLLAFVKANGVVTMELILLGAYWQQPIYAEKFQHGTDPTSVFARLGLLTALPSHSVHAFEQFIASRNTVYGPGSAQ
jgi:hypothetical protein